MCGITGIIDTRGRSDISRAVLQRYAASPGFHDPPSSRWVRAMAHASLGDNKAALDELESAERSGYRTLIDVDYFQRIQDYPFAAGLIPEPRFRQFLQRIQSANLQMRAALQGASRAR